MYTDPSHQSNGFSTPTQFRSKLGTYLSGVVIGFIMLGMIYFMKHLATEREKAEQQSQQAIPTEPSP